MKHNRLGKSDLMVSELGFGCMSLPSDEQLSTKLVHQALELGVNFFDTADLYEQGRNEELLGLALKGKRQEAIVATKVGNRWQSGQTGWAWDPSPKYIKSAVHDSLRRLRTDYIDLYQLHGGTLEDPFEDVIESFEELRQAGYIRWYGISSIRPNVIRRWVEQSNLVSVMMQYSILDRRPEEEMLDLLNAHQVSVIVRGPLSRGILSDSGSVRISENGYLDYTKSELEGLFASLKSLANPTRTISQLALRYCLAHPAVATTIPGVSSSQQLSENVSANTIPPLSEDELNLIQQWSKANIYQKHR